VLDGHETELREASLLGVGVVWIDQSVPSQRSASVWGTVLFCPSPTAVHWFAELHETELSRPFDAVGVGTDCTCQPAAAAAAGKQTSTATMTPQSTHVRLTHAPFT
jgi:hypothetical protein